MASGLLTQMLGGSSKKESSSSTNQGYGAISGALTPVMGNAATGANALGSLLGGDASGFNAYKKATGFDDLMAQGSRGITGGAAANGLLRSGSTGKALVNYGNTMQNQYANSYMSNLFNQANIGLDAGKTIGAAGATSKGSSSATETGDGGKKSGLGMLASFVPGL
jgi:hypothetical protein